MANSGLKIVRALVVDGRPDAGRYRRGRFEDESSLVRNRIAWPNAAGNRSTHKSTITVTRNLIIPVQVLRFETVLSGHRFIKKIIEPLIELRDELVDERQHKQR